MSRIDNVVFINSGFNHGKSDIEDAFRTHDSVLLQAQSEAIQTAISLAEFFVNKEKIAFYDRFTSNLVQDEHRALIPKCSIVLKYAQPTKQNPSQRAGKGTKESKQPRFQEKGPKNDNRGQQPSRKVYRERSEDNQDRERRGSNNRNKR